jgi:hypothetical protein
MGAGHLNVNQAIRQLSAGRYANYGSLPVTSIPRRGWGDHLIFPASLHEYVFTQDVEGWVAVTICWDREVEHTGGQTYHYGDQFFPYDESYSRLNDLDVYLVRASDNFIVSSSVSYEHTEEHIFADVPFGRYKIVVDHVGESLGTAQKYSIAWWADSPYLAGDYDEDNQIDNGDYLVWRSQAGATVPAGTGADGNNDRFVDAADYVIWRKNVTAGSGSFTVVPEPSVLMLLAALGACLTLRRTNRVGCHWLFDADEVRHCGV